MSEREQKNAMTTYGMLTTVKELETKIEEIRNLLDDLTKMKEGAAQKLSEYALAVRVAGFKEAELDQFFRKPYVLLPRKEQEWYLIVPRFIDLQVGWLERQTESFNIFVVNRYIDWITEVPQLIREELGFKPSLPITVRGDFLYTDRDHIDEVWKRYRNHLSRREGDKIRIRKRRHFSLICALVRDGILPFDPKPVDSKDLIDRKPKFELDFMPSQKEAWNKFLHYGVLGVYWPPRGGKTFLGMYAMSHLKGKKLIIVPTVTLKEQWESRIKEYTNVPSSEYEIITYHASRKPAYLDKEYTLTIYDEVQHLPANIFSRLALLNTKYRMGLSATPFREDGRTELIFALSGFPIGLDWASFLKLQIIKKPTVDLHIVRNVTEKIVKIDEILKESDKKTIIFCDSIRLGKILASKFNTDFIYSQTKKRLEKIYTLQTSVVSRVGDEGISLGKLERVIEADFLFGSRRQELQRLGRLFHSEFKGEHHIIMTEEQYSLYKKRLYGVLEKGFEISIHKQGS